MIPLGSRPLVGSSRISSDGLWSSATAMLKPLLHAERKLSGLLLPRAGQPDEIQHFRDAATGTPVNLLQDRQVFARGEMVVERRAFDQRADVPEDLDAVRVEALLEDRDRPLLHLQQPQDQSQGGGLSRAVRPQEAIDAALRHLEVDAASGRVRHRSIGD